MMPRMCWTQLGLDGKAVRILKSAKLVGVVPRAAYILRMTAVDDIRRAVWERDKRRCAHCGVAVGYNVMELHERLWRGRGGEISLQNSVCLCYPCHQHDEMAGHGKRRPQW